MRLVDLAEHYGQFYAPAFAIRVGGRDLVRDALVPVSQVEVDLELGATSRFSFTVVNTFDLEAREFRTGSGASLLDLLAFGTRIEIRLGYQDDRSMPVMLTGVVTSLTTDFPESGTPDLVVSGYDQGFPLTNGKNTRSWSNRTDSAAVQDIAAFHNLALSADSTREMHAQIEQNQESDFEFAKKLAERNHFVLYVDATGQLHFAAPHDRETAVVTLDWGAGLLSFKPEANLAGQVSGVRVYGWDPQRKEQIVGRAGAGDESDLVAGTLSAAQRMGGVTQNLGRQPLLRLRQPVYTQAEANQRARAALNERAQQFVTGEGEAIGLPELRPDRRVTLGGLGRPFSRTYYIEKTTHKVDSNGYRTRFKVKDSAL